MCYGMLRAAACVDESDHHALMYVRHGQTDDDDGDLLFFFRGGKDGLWAGSDAR